MKARQQNTKKADPKIIQKMLKSNIHQEQWYHKNTINATLANLCETRGYAKNR